MHVAVFSKFSGVQKRHGEETRPAPRRVGEGEGPLGADSPVGRREVGVPDGGRPVGAVTVLLDSGTAQAGRQGGTPRSRGVRCLLGKRGRPGLTFAEKQDVTWTDKT